MILPGGKRGRPSLLFRSRLVIKFMRVNCFEPWSRPCDEKMHSCPRTRKRIKRVHVRARSKSSLFNIGQTSELAYSEARQRSRLARESAFGMIDAFYILPSPEAYASLNIPQLIHATRCIIFRERFINQANCLIYKYWTNPRWLIAILTLGSHNFRDCYVTSTQL